MMIDWWNGWMTRQGMMKWIEHLYKRKDLTREKRTYQRDEEGGKGDGKGKEGAKQQPMSGFLLG